MRRDFDVVVVGGAMAGAGAAALLAASRGTQGLRIALLEPRPQPPLSAGDPFDLRVSALSRASERLLLATGAWAAVRRRAAPFERMVVWEERSDPGGGEALVFDAAEQGEPDLGHIAENRAIQAALLDRAEQAGVVLLRAGVESIAFGDAAARLRLQDGREVTTALVVGADGADSAVRRLASIDARSRDYGQRAVVAHLAPERPHAATAWQRFLDTGPLALLPLPDGRVSLVWSALPEQAAALRSASERAFEEQVTAASAGVLGRLSVTTPRADFPLRLLHARRYAGTRVVLVGDAAHTVHPLAGQGINLAFLDAAALADVLGEALAAGDDPGERRVLRRYERWRKAEALPAVALLDGLQRLYFGGDPAKSRLRRGALALARYARPARRLLAERALGIAGEIPASLTSADPRPSSRAGTRAR